MVFLSFLSSSRVHPASSSIPAIVRLWTSATGLVPDSQQLKQAVSSILVTTVMGAPYREVNSKVATAPNTPSR